MRKLFFKSMLLLCALIVGSGNVWADPVVLFHETFGDNSGSARDWNNSYSVKSGESAVYSGISSYTVSNAKQGKNTTGSTKSGLNQSSQGTDAYIIIGPLNVESYESLSLTYQWKAASIKGTYSTSLYYATSSGGSYTEVSGTGTGATTFVERSYSLPAAAQVSTLYLKIVWNTSNTQAIIDEVDLQGVSSSGGGGGSSVATPTFSPEAGAVTIGTNVSISCATAGATIHYTIDGSNPTTSSPTYSSAITIDAAKTIKALAVKDGLTNSEIASAEYTIAQVATPTFSPDAGEVTKDTEITINCATDGATIYYTTDGSEPSTSSSVYDPSSKPTIDDDKTIKAIAVKTNHQNSEIASAEYTYARVKDYTLITSISNIISGKHYLIASGKENGSVKVLDAQNTNNRGVKECTISSGTLQATGAREIVIYGPDKDGYYVFFDAVEKGYLYAASNSSNHLKTQLLITDNGRFSISIDGSSSQATIIAQGSNSHNSMRYNSSSSLFSCYESGQALVYLFALDGEDAPIEAISVSALGWSTFTSPNALDFTGISTISAYQITGASGTTLTLSQISGKVPARTGLLISGTNAEVPATYGAISTNVSKNKLVGCIIDTKIQNANPHKTTIYVLVDNDGIAEFQNVASYVASTDVTIPANKAYLDLDGITLAPSALRIVDEENNATGIENIKSGEKVVKFIKNGRILILRDGITYDALGRIVK